MKLLNIQYIDSPNDHTIEILVDCVPYLFHGYLNYDDALLNVDH
jgi:hypothetical protein